MIGLDTPFIPIAVIVTILVHTGLVLLWAGRASARLDMLETRLEAQSGVSERLARLEEQALAQRASLARIEASLNRELQKS